VSVAVYTIDDPAALSFLQALAHEHRWQLVRALAESDRRVNELTGLLGEPQNLVSYHLRQLRDVGVVTSRRSSADRRDTYYRVDLDRVGELLCATGAAVQPGLLLGRCHGATPPASGRRRRVLFLCTGNSARSQMAEALTEHLSGHSVDVRSAGSHPKALHPNAYRVMAERGIDISDRSSKHLRRFTRMQFDQVITLCDRVREVCPEFPHHPRLVHWSIPDPALEGESDAASLPAFERTARELEARIGYLLVTLTTAHTTGGMS
jgi:protein-tyrosine-phosphatase